MSDDAISDPDLETVSGYREPPDPTDAIRSRHGTSPASTQRGRRARLRGWRHKAYLAESMLAMCRADLAKAEAALALSEAILSQCRSDLIREGMERDAARAAADKEHREHLQSVDTLSESVPSERNRSDKAEAALAECRHQFLLQSDCSHSECVDREDEQRDRADKAEAEWVMWRETARRITDDAWAEILTYGRAPLENLATACSAIDAAQGG